MSLRQSSTAGRKRQELDAAEGLGHVSPFFLILRGHAFASSRKDVAKRPRSLWRHRGMQRVATTRAFPTTAPPRSGGVPRPSTAVSRCSSTFPEPRNKHPRSLFGPPRHHPPDLSGEAEADTSGCCPRPPSQGCPCRPRSSRAGPGALITGAHTEPRPCRCGGARVPQPRFLRASRARAVTQVCRGPDRLCPRSRGPAGTRPRCAAFPPSAPRAHPSAGISPLVPPAVPPFPRSPGPCPAPPSLPPPALHPGLSGGHRLCRGAGGGPARPGPARPWHGSLGSPLSRGAANNCGKTRGRSRAGSGPRPPVHTPCPRSHPQPGAETPAPGTRAPPPHRPGAREG